MTAFFCLCARLSYVCFAANFGHTSFASAWWWPISLVPFSFCGALAFSALALPSAHHAQPAKHRPFPPRQETEEESKARIAGFDADHRASPSSSSSSVLGSLIRSAGLVSGGGTSTSSDVAIVPSPNESKAGPLEQFRLLLARSWRQVNRAKFANATRVRTVHGGGEGILVLAIRLCSRFKLSAIGREDEWAEDEIQREKA